MLGIRRDRSVQRPSVLTICIVSKGNILLLVERNQTQLPQFLAEGVWIQSYWKLTGTSSAICLQLDHSALACLNKILSVAVAATPMSEHVCLCTLSDQVLSAMCEDLVQSFDGSRKLSLSSTRKLQVAFELELQCSASSLVYH